MPSPILSLQQSLAAAPFSMAPERADELKAWRDGGKFHLALSDESGFRFRVRLDDHAAVLPIAALEYMWCTAHATFVLAQEYAATQRTGASRLEIGASERSHAALGLLTWARQNMLHGHSSDWPATSPNPTARDSKDVRSANELYLAAMAWIILHEIGHVVLQHGVCLHAPYSLQQEKEADHYATEWALSKSTVPAQSTKRMFGIATALLAMQLLHAPAEGRTKSDTHPAPIERIHYFLEQANPPDDGSICGYIAPILQFQLAQFGLRPTIEGESIRDILSGFLLAFAKGQ